jgi:hypothetical protein
MAHCSSLPQTSGPTVLRWLPMSLPAPVRNTAVVETGYLPFDSSDSLDPSRFPELLFAQ